jgi:hypothetical protein
MDRNVIDAFEHDASPKPKDRLSYGAFQGLLLNVKIRANGVRMPVDYG